MKTDSLRPSHTQRSDTTPLLRVASSSSHGPAPSVSDVSLRTSRSRLWQSVDSRLSGLKPRARVESTPSPGVYVDHDSCDSFKQSTLDALNRLSSIPTGRTVLTHVASIHEMYPEKRVVILPTNDPSEDSVTAAAWHAPKNIMPGFNFVETVVARPTGDSFMPWVAGTGADSAVIRYNDQSGRDFSRDPHMGERSPAHSFVVLGHEMIHASRILHGGQYVPPVGNPLADDSPRAEEELRTTGAGPWRDEPVTENAMRREFGLPERASYAGNVGSRLPPPPEKNSDHTEWRLRSLGARKEKHKQL